MQTCDDGGHDGGGFRNVAHPDRVEADLDGTMLYIVNQDAPGFIGRLGSTLGEAQVNIGTFHLGRRDQGGEAVLLLSVDGTVTEPLRWEICNLTGVKQVKLLRFA